MKKVFLLFACLTLVSMQVFAQRTVTGTVTSADDGMGLPGVSVIVKGTQLGTITDMNGSYSIDVPGESNYLVFQFMGMETQEVEVTGNIVDVAMVSSDIAIDDVVVTALGVTREKKSLGYATQEVKGDDLTTVHQDNFVNSLSGKVSGVQIRTNNNFGGSTNIVVRGITSITGGNQALFVVDGVPIDNSTGNTSSQRGGSTGYDYGNAASDMNPDDIESVNVLKGAAATSLYGSRAANGVILITTKKGKARKGLGVSYSGSLTVGTYDKNTFLEYQKEYGAGYGPYYGSTGYFEDVDINGGTDGPLVSFAVPTYDDGSYGPKYADVTDNIWQWDSYVPEATNYGKPYKYQAAENDPNSFFETEITYVNSVGISGGNEKGTFRLGYTNYKTNGILPNSKLLKHNFSINSDYKFTDRLQGGANINYVYQDALGRNSTGYSDNIMSSFRQWFQVNVDVKELERLYTLTGRNVTWNANAPWDGDFTPLYWDSPYWTRFENYSTDTRGRLFGSVNLNYKLTDWLRATGKLGLDTYSTIREERRAVGSTPAPFGVLRGSDPSGYQRYNRDFSELNFDFMLNFNQTFGDLSLNGLAGMNIRRTTLSTILASTNGGLVVPELYALSNSVSSNPTPTEYVGKKQVNGYYINASLGYKNFVYIEPSYRYDISSALPNGNWAYGYFSVSGTLIFSELIDFSVLDLGKLRLNYAEVGNDLNELNVFDTYTKPDNFGSSTLFSVNSQKNNSDLKPERTKSIELGLEMNFLKNRFGFDFALYKMNTLDQLIPSDISRATGYSSKYVNAGNIENKGFELSVFGKPVRTNDFVWETRINWSANRSLVKELYVNPATGEPLENIVLASYQGGITINAALDEPYGVMKGTGFQFDDNGNKVVNASGYYIAVADQIIADPNPDWIGGWYNSLSYKGLTFSFLIDVQQGGEVFSLDMHYGQGTGMPASTVGLNDKGNPIRDAVADGGGILNPGVKEDGTPNDIYADATFYGGAFYWGNAARNPVQKTVYDASYIKLREMSLSYKLPKTFMNKYIQNASIGIVGRNLWIIKKHVPYADPEAGLGAGNAQGYLSGAYPTVRQIGFNLKFDF